MERIQRDWLKLQEHIEQFKQDHGKNVVCMSSSEIIGTGTCSLKESTKREIRETIQAADEAEVSMPDSPKELGARELRSVVTGLLGTKRTHRYNNNEKPDWWSSTDVPFMSPWKVVNGRTLSKAQLVELVESAKTFFQRPEARAEGQDTPQAGASGNEIPTGSRRKGHVVPTELRTRRLRLQCGGRENMGRARRNLFGHDDDGDQPEGDMMEALSEGVEEETVDFSSLRYNNLKKIGEGTFGEVYTGQANGGDVVIKIIPYDGHNAVNGQTQTPWKEVKLEIEVAKALTTLRPRKTTSFCELKGYHFVCGSYPQVFLDQWDAYNNRKGSENDRPDFFPDDQKYVVFEFNDCGQDLESYQVKSVAQAKSIVLQVAYALSVAERAFEFEHRDLHWGNVLCKDTDDDSIHFYLEGRDHVVASHGVRVSIIDFTLSRLTKDRLTLFVNLGLDEQLFTGEGDIQFKVYRDMKAKLRNDWERHEPATNVLWIKYLIDKLTVSKVYGRGKASVRDLNALKRVALTSSSAFDFISNV